MSVLVVMRAVCSLALVLVSGWAFPCGEGVFGPLPPKIGRILARFDDQHERDLESDVKLGREAAAEVAKETKPSEDLVALERVRRIGAELSEVANRTAVQVTWGDQRLNSFSYEFHLVQGEDVNAFSLPGGFIYVYEGLVKFAESDDELAGVLAHEIAHASFRHIATLRREQSKFDIVNIPLILAAILSRSSQAAQVVQGVGLLNQAVYSGWSLKAEESADYGGLQYMLASKYEPVGMLTFMERLAFRDRSKPQIDWGIYQTHPPSSERAEALTKRMRERDLTIRRSASSTSLRSAVRPGEDGQVDLLFGKSLVYSFRGEEALVRADAASARLDALFDAVPELYEVDVLEETRIVGRYVEIFDARPEDGEDYRHLASEALKTIKRLVFDLNYRLWPNHARATFRG